MTLEQAISDGDLAKLKKIIGKDKKLLKSRFTQGLVTISFMANLYRI